MMNDTTSAAIASSVSVGQLLLNARTAAGLTVLEVAHKLNLTVSVIENLEQDQFAQLPGTTFARGYIRSYAKLLHLDANQLVQAFDHQVGAAAEVSEVHTIDRVGTSRRVSRGMLQFGLFLLLLLILAAVYYGWQSRQTSAALASQKSPVFERVEVERADGSMHVQTIDELEDQAVALVLENQTANLADESSVTALDSSLTDTETVDVLSTGLETHVEPAQSADTPETEKLAPGMGIARISFTHDCWLRIIDADGKQIATGLQRGGEQLTVTGKAPLDVHLGYAKGVSIVYNGEAVDFSSAVSGETARIKLGQ
jgi:cytoskeleton protein RodZ